MKKFFSSYTSKLNLNYNQLDSISFLIKKNINKNFTIFSSIINNSEGSFIFNTRYVKNKVFFSKSFLKINSYSFSTHTDTEISNIKNDSFQQNHSENNQENEEFLNATSNQEQTQNYLNNEKKPHAKLQQNLDLVYNRNLLKENYEKIILKFINDSKNFAVSTDDLKKNIAKSKNNKKGKKESTDIRENYEIDKNINYNNKLIENCDINDFPQNLVNLNSILEKENYNNLIFLIENINYLNLKHFIELLTSLEYFNFPKEDILKINSLILDFYTKNNNNILPLCFLTIDYMGSKKNRRLINTDLYKKCMEIIRNENELNMQKVINLEYFSNFLNSLSNVQVLDKKMNDLVINFFNNNSENFDENVKVIF